MTYHPAVARLFALSFVSITPMFMSGCGDGGRGGGDGGGRSSSRGSGGGGSQRSSNVNGPPVLSTPVATRAFIRSTGTSKHKQMSANSQPCRTSPRIAAKDQKL